MRPIKFPGWNRPYGQPAGWDADLHGPCGVLPVLDTGLEGTSVSVWRPAWHERLLLIFGGSVVLTIVGRQPPVHLDVQTIEELPDDALPHPAPRIPAGAA